MSVYGFQIYGATGNLHFDINSVALMLHDSFEVTGTTAYNESYTWDEDVNAAFMVVETQLDNNVGFMFNCHATPNSSVVYNNPNRTVTISGTPSYTNVGVPISSWSTYVGNSKMKFLIYVSG